MMRSDSSNAFLNLDGERVARVRQTQKVMPPQMSNVSRTSSLHQVLEFNFALSSKFKTCKVFLTGLYF